MIQYDNRGRKIISPNQEDPRYTIRLFLLREKRPKYWNFHCIYCGNKVCEINGIVLYMTDISSEGVSSNTMARIRCNSRQCGGRAWFEFGF